MEGRSYAWHDNLSCWFSGAFHLLSLTGLELHVDQTNWIASSQDSPASASYVTAQGSQVYTISGFWRWQRLYQLNRLPNPLPMNFELIPVTVGHVRVRRGHQIVITNGREDRFCTGQLHEQPCASGPTLGDLGTICPKGNDHTAHHCVMDASQVRIKAPARNHCLDAGNLSFF